MAAVLDRVDNAFGASIGYTIGGLSVLVDVVLLTIGLIRGRRVPAWAAVGLPVACVVNIVGFGAACNAVVAFELGAAAAAALDGRDRDRNEAVGAPLVRPVEVL
jgi:hypothetical protein